MSQYPSANVVQKDIELYYDDDIGKVIVPGEPHKDRRYGGHLIVLPRYRSAHCISTLLYEDPEGWRFLHLLCALTAQAMLEMLPCLNGHNPDGREGMVNVFDGGNWGVHDESTNPPKPKSGRYKRVHVHIYGRSPLEPKDTEQDRALHWGWGEAPTFPRHRSRQLLMARQFTDDERFMIKTRLTDLIQIYNIVPSKPPDP